MKLNTPTGTKVAGGLVLLLLAGLGWMFVVGPETDKLAAARQAITDARDQNDVLRLQLVTLKKQAEQLDATRETAQALASKFPPTADQPGLFKAVTAAAVDAGIGAQGVTTLAPTPPTIGGVDPTTGVQLATPTGAQLARQTVSVSVEGTYDQTQRLLQNLEQIPRAYLVSSVTLGGGASEGAYTTTIVGDMFVMPPVADPGDVAVEDAAGE